MLNEINAFISAFISAFVQQVVGVVDITTLNNRQYCVILDPVDKDGKPQLGQKKLVKVQYVLMLRVEAAISFLKQFLGSRSIHITISSLTSLFIFFFACIKVVSSLANSLVSFSLIKKTP